MYAPPRSLNWLSTKRNNCIIIVAHTIPPSFVTFVCRHSNLHYFLIVGSVYVYFLNTCTDAQCTHVGVQLVQCVPLFPIATVVYNICTRVPCTPRSTELADQMTFPVYNDLTREYFAPIVRLARRRRRTHILRLPFYYFLTHRRPLVLKHLLPHPRAATTNSVFFALALVTLNNSRVCSHTFQLYTTLSFSKPLLFLYLVHCVPSPAPFGRPTLSYMRAAEDNRIAPRCSAVYNTNICVPCEQFWWKIPAASLERFV